MNEYESGDGRRPPSPRACSVTPTCATHALTARGVGATRRAPATDSDLLRGGRRALHRWPDGDADQPHAGIHAGPRDDRGRALRRAADPIAASDATIDGHVRGHEAPGAPDQRELYIQDLTSAERSRFLHAYEKLFADAERYYLQRPKPGGRSSAAPLGGQHHTIIAVEHGLVSRLGEAVFAGSRASVREAVYTYRNAGYHVAGDEMTDPQVVVISADGTFTTTLEVGDMTYTRGGSK